MSADRFETQVEAARVWLDESVAEIRADRPGEEIDEGSMYSDLIVSMAAIGEFPKAVVREISRRELGYLPQGAEAFL